MMHNFPNNGIIQIITPLTWYFKIISASRIYMIEQLQKELCLWETPASYWKFLACKIDES